MKRLLILFLLALPAGLFAQATNPDYGPLFLQDEVASIHVQLDPDSFAYMLANLEYAKEHDFPATFIYQSTVYTDTIKDIGFRLRGNTSIRADKKSFKVSFNAFDPGVEYFGVDKLNLNGEHNDPSVMRARLCWEAQRKIGLPAPRASHIRLFVNGNYRGLYLNVEHIDREFVASRFGDEGIGNLYKCLWPADLDYMGQNPKSYDFSSNGRPVYDLKTNELARDYSDLAAFIDLINNAPLSQLKCALEKSFNINDYLKIAAFDILTANWDGYITNKNNYYLYHNYRSDRFEFISYDLDNTLGIDWFGIDWSTRDPYNWSLGKRPLYTRILQVPAFRKRLTHYLDELARGPLHPDTLRRRAGYLQSLIFSAVEQDPFYPKAYGFDTVAFNSSVEQGWGSHVPKGIAEYMDDRLSSLSAQLDVLDDDFSALNHLSSDPLLSDTLWIKALADFNPDSVVVQILIDSLTGTSNRMFDDGQSRDLLAGDGLYGLGLLIPKGSEMVEYTVESWKNGKKESAPCVPRTLDLRESELPIYINEFMASNSSVVADEFGDYDDWIELYNDADTSVSLMDVYLTDNPNLPGRWKMPPFNLGPKGFMLIWADRSTSEGLLHTNFKLKRSGEAVYAFQRQGDAYRLIDGIEFGGQVQNISMGRERDGGLPWIRFLTPTPNASNEQDSPQPDQFYIWPNPNTGSSLFLSIPDDVVVFDIHGREVFSGSQVKEIEIQGYAPGLYLLKHSKGVSRFIVQ